MSHRKAHWLGLCCAILVILTCAASTASSTASPGALELSASGYSVAPSAGAVTVTVERAGGSSGIAVASYGTFNGSAVAGTDYTAAFGTMTWPDGDSTPQTFVVHVAPGGAGAKSFTVALLSASNAAFGTPINATVFISAGAAGGSAGSACSSSSPTSSTACLLAFINGLSGQSRHILSGQHTNYWDSNPMDIVTPIPAATGSQVAILGLTNYWTRTASTDYGTAPESFVQYANDWIAQGGIVLVSQSPPNPLSTVSGTLADVHTPGTAAYNQWHSYLDTQIARFKQINGTVIWRPFIELNGSWSWWVSNEGSLQADFILIWQQTHDYFAANGVNNVLWLFNVNTWDSSADVTSWYPGSAYVDLVSLDAYPPAAQGDTPVYNALVATGKPIMYAEVGVNSPTNSGSGDYTTVLATIKANFPKVFAVVVWCQGWALSLQGGESAFMSDPAIITLSDVPAALLNR